MYIKKCISSSVNQEVYIKLESILLGQFQCIWTNVNFCVDFRETQVQFFTVFDFVLGCLAKRFEAAGSQNSSFFT